LTTSERVLVVDDLPDWSEAIARLLLQREGIGEVRTAASLDEAEAAIDSFEPTVVISDLRLSAEDIEDLSGLEVCRIARERDPTPRLLVVTGHSTVQLDRRLLELGAEVFDKSMLDPAELVDAVARVPRRTSMSRASRSS